MPFICFKSSIHFGTHHFGFVKFAYNYQFMFFLLVYMNELQVKVKGWLVDFNGFKNFELQNVVTS